MLAILIAQCRELGLNHLLSVVIYASSSYQSLESKGKINAYGDEMMKDFVPYSETEVVDLPIDTDPNEGILPEDALGKEGSIWD